MKNYRTSAQSPNMGMESLFNRKLKLFGLATSACAVMSYCISSSVYAFPVAGGAGELVPSLALEFGYDTNVDTAPSDEVSDTYTNLELALQFTGQTRFSDLSGSYRILGSRYSDSNDTEIDHFLDLGWVRPISPRHTLSFSASLNSDSEDTVNNANQSVESDYMDSNVGVSLEFGSEGSLLAAIGSIDFSNRSYDDSELGTDSNGVTLGGEFQWNVLPKTSVVLKGAAEKIDYDPDQFLSGDKIGASVGITWQALNKTTGRLFVGRTNRDYDDPDFDSTSITTTEISVTWNPANFTQISFTHSIDLQDAGNSDGFASIESMSNVVELKHSLSDVLSVSADVSFTEDVYTQPVNDSGSRSDDTTNLSLSLERDLSDRSLVVFSLQREDKTSALESFNYVQDIAFIRYEYTF